MSLFPSHALTAQAVLLTLATVIMGCAARTEFFLPDTFFIDRQCQAFLANPQVQKACTAYKNGEIDGDKWLSQVSPVLRSSALDKYRPGESVTVSLRSMQPVPKDYATYSLALFPSTHYKPSEVESLRRAFFAFGNAIGTSHAALWFQPDQTVKLKAEKEAGQSSQVDHQRSKDYCDRFGLSYNAGPYVVTTRRRPDAIREGDEQIVIQLRGISPDRVVFVLNILEEDLRNAREIRRRTLLFEEIKQLLLSVLDHRPDIIKDVLVK